MNPQGKLSVPPSFRHDVFKFQFSVQRNLQQRPSNGHFNESLFADLQLDGNDARLRVNLLSAFSMKCLNTLPGITSACVNVLRVALVDKVKTETDRPVPTRRERPIADLCRKVSRVILRGDDRRKTRHRLLSQMPILVLPVAVQRFPDNRLCRRKIIVQERCLAGPFRIRSNWLCDQGCRQFFGGEFSGSTQIRQPRSALFNFDLCLTEQAFCIVTLQCGIPGGSRKRYGNDL